MLESLADDQNLGSAVPGAWFSSLGVTSVRRGDLMMKAPASPPPRAAKPAQQSSPSLQTDPLGTIFQVYTKTKPDAAAKEPSRQDRWVRQGSYHRVFL